MLRRQVKQEVDDEEAELVEQGPETRAALRAVFGAEGTDCEDLATVTPKQLQNMLKRSCMQVDLPAAAGSVLALRDALLAAEKKASSPLRCEFDKESDRQMQQQAADAAAIAADKAAAVAAATHTAIVEVATKAEEAAAKVALSCEVCFEPYGEEAVPRMLVASSHTFCHACLSKMLRCAGSSPHCTAIA